MTPPLDGLGPVVAVEDVLWLQDQAERVRTDESVLDYVMALVSASRRSPLLVLGVSPRGALALLRSAKAYALADGRDYLVPDDVKRLAVPALSHRVIVRTRAAGAPDTGRGESAADAETVIRAIVREVPVPR